MTRKVTVNSAPGASDPAKDQRSGPVEATAGCALMAQAVTNAVSVPAQVAGKNVVKGGVTSLITSVARF